MDRLTGFQEFLDIIGFPEIREFDRRFAHEEDPRRCVDENRHAQVVLGGTARGRAAPRRCVGVSPHRRAGALPGERSSRPSEFSAEEARVAAGHGTSTTTAIWGAGITTLDGLRASVLP